MKHQKSFLLSIGNTGGHKDSYFSMDEPPMKMGRTTFGNSLTTQIVRPMAGNTFVNPCEQLLQQSDPAFKLSYQPA